MGFFENLGRKVEKFKQNVEESAAEDDEFACTACGASFTVDYDACPDCGSDAVEPLE